MSENFVTRETRRWNGFGVASHIEVRAPPESVWNALIDIDNKALFLSCLESTRRIGSKIGDPVRAGTRWKQTRKQLVFGRLARTRSVSVTCMAIDDQPPDVFPKSMSVISHAEGSAATGTLSVELIDDAEDEGDRCRLVVSFALVPHSFTSKIFFTSFFGQFLINKYSIKHVTSDMKDLAAYCELNSIHPNPDARKRQMTMK